MADPPSGRRGLVTGADDACRRGDLAALSRLVQALVPHLPHALQFEAVAVAELAALDEALACERWRELAGVLCDAPPPPGYRQQAGSSPRIKASASLALSRNPL